MSSPKTDRQIELTLCSLLRGARRSLRIAERLEVAGSPHEDAWNGVQTRFGLLNQFMETAGKYQERTKHQVPPPPTIQTEAPCQSPRVKQILGMDEPPIPPATAVPAPTPQPEEEPMPAPPPEAPAPAAEPEPTEPPPRPTSYVGMSKAQFERECRREAEREREDSRRIWL